MIGLIEVGVEREKEKQNPTEEEKKQSTWKNTSVYIVSIYNK
jgi:hypothetical protein